MKACWNCITGDRLFSCEEKGLPLPVKCIKCGDEKKMWKPIKKNKKIKCSYCKTKTHHKLNGIGMRICEECGRYK